MIDRLAEQLRNASETGTPCDPLTASEPSLTIDQAYKVQAHNLDRRMKRDGLFRVGVKIGLTSAAIQEWLGVNEPDFGVLLSDMAVPNGGQADIGRLLQPRVEGELAFVMKRNMKGPGVSASQVIANVDYVLPAIEIIDSRIKDWKITIQDTIADNASSGLFVIGSRPTRLKDLDTRTIGMTLRKNGSVVSTGAGAACLDDPINAVVWLVNKLGEFGVGVEAGETILSGALGPVSPVVRGDFISASIGRMGEVSVRFR